MVEPAANHYASGFSPALVLECFDQPVSFHRAYLRITEHVAAAVLLGHLVDLAHAAAAATATGADTWFPVAQQSVTATTGLSRWEWETGRRVLREKGLLRERKKGSPPILEGFLDSHALTSALEQHAQDNWGAVCAQLN